VSGVLLAPDDPWAGYARTVVGIVHPELGRLEVRAAPVGTTGVWPWSTAVPVHLLTAWDPGDERPGADVNRTRQAALETELRARGPAMWPAAGSDPETDDRDEGVAVCGLAEAEVLELAARYDQDAVFAWTPTEWAIVACRGSRRVSLGWSLTRAGPAFPAGAGSGQGPAP
jgi:hypothetical protein